MDLHTLSLRIGVDTLKKILSKFSTLRLLDCGGFACAWELRDNRVLKITTDASDALIALRRTTAPELDKVLAQIDEVLVVNPQSDDAETAFIIISEKLSTHLPQVLDDSVDNLYTSVMRIADYYQTQNKEINWKKVLNMAAAETESSATNRLVIKKFELLIKAGAKLECNLLWDAAAKNWGLRDPSDPESLVLLDFGISNPESMEDLNNLPNLRVSSFAII